MSFIGDLFGSGKAKAAREAADEKAAAIRQGAKLQGIAADEAKAIEEDRGTAAISRLDPYANAGAQTIGDLTSLVNDPNAQLKYIQENPFFKSLADDAQQRLFANQAATGKLGSGDTAKALQNSILLLGDDLLQKTITNRMNLSGMGQAAAADQANLATGQARTLEDLTLQKANADAAGLIGSADALGGGRVASADARGAGAMNVAKLASSVFLAASDMRMKTDIERIGENQGIPIYSFRFKGKPELHVGVMAQDIEKIKPDAVTEINGVKHVDYAKLWH